ncbi:MAG: ABC-2 transporter permease [Niameybacter sp.]
MKGLVLNNFYAMQNNIKISFVISLLLAIVSVGLKEPKLISMVIAAQIFVIMGNIATTMHVDEASKWNKMEITLPVKWDYEHSFCIKCGSMILELEKLPK